jgi:hypothetical protein
MTYVLVVPSVIATSYDVLEWRYGIAILIAAHHAEWGNFIEVLRGFWLLKSDILQPCGSN